MATLPDGRHEVLFGSPGNRLEISTSEVLAYVDGTLYPVRLTADGAMLIGREVDGPTGAVGTTRARARR